MSDVVVRKVDLRKIEIRNEALFVDHNDSPFNDLRKIAQHRFRRLQHIKLEILLNHLVQSLYDWMFQ